MKILFMGTPDFAVPVLEALIAAGHEVVLAVTQPDKAAGRSKALVPPPVKVCAQAHGIPVFQPERVRRPEAMAELGKVEADLGVVVAFGQILPQALLDLPSHGCFNVHASLLPMYRGASPINHVILAGEKESGVTIMQMDAGIDTGDILLQEAVPIEEDETAETLAEKLSALGARLIVRAVEALEDGTLPRTPQEGETCYAGMLKKELGMVVDWSRIDKEDYLLAMERSPVKDIEIKHLLKNALTDQVNNREVFMKGIDHSYYYEGYNTFKTEEL